MTYSPGWHRRGLLGDVVMALWWGFVARLLGSFVPSPDDCAQPGSHPPKSSIDFHLVNSRPPRESRRYENDDLEAENAPLTLCPSDPAVSLIPFAVPRNEIAYT